MPEARIILAEAVSYVASAPKSNASYMAIDAALDYVKNHKTASVPAHLQDAHYKSAEKLGHGVGYQYAHSYPMHYVKQQYLPDGMEDISFYEPTEIGYEKKIRDYQKMLKELPETFKS